MPTCIAIRIGLRAILVLSLFSSGCATFEEYQAHADARYRAQVCSYEKAFAFGNNDALANRPMRGMVAAKCDISIQAEVQQGYRDGYTEAKRNQPVKVQVQSSSSHHMVAHNAVDASGDISSKVKPRSRHRHAAQFECHAVGDKGQICGYNCIVFDGQWHCANHPDARCVKKDHHITCSGA